MFKRIILKLSGEYLAGNTKNNPDDSITHIDYTVTDKIVSDIINIVKEGTETAIVIGGGNFWRGRDTTVGFDRAKADYMGMLASVMNGILLSERFITKGISAGVMTPFSVGGMTSLYSQDTASDRLSRGEVVIFSGGTGQPYFSTDTISVIRAAELKADCVLFAKDAPGVCNKDPKKNPKGSYEIYREITAQKIIDDNLTVIDAAAMIIARDNKVPCALFDLSANSAIHQASMGFESIKTIGTIITP